MSVPEDDPWNESWNPEEDAHFEMEKAKERDDGTDPGKGEQYVPEGYYVVEDADGERLVKKEGPPS